MTAVIRLFALFSLLFMPFGMAAGAMQAPVASHHSPTMAMSHCPDEGSKQDQHHSGFAECTMACAAALPAVEAPRAAPVTIVCLPERPAAAHRLDGIHPEIATPPPRHS